MNLFSICTSCKKRRILTRAWYYHHFAAGRIHDKEENAKCYPCHKVLQRALDAMKPA